eukprot:5869702-Prymnesium_polylepis.1
MVGGCCRLARCESSTTPLREQHHNPGASCHPFLSPRGCHTRQEPHASRINEPSTSFEVRNARQEPTSFALPTRQPAASQVRRDHNRSRAGDVVRARSSPRSRFSACQIIKPSATLTYDGYPFTSSSRFSYTPRMSGGRHALHTGFLARVASSKCHIGRRKRQPRRQTLTMQTAYVRRQPPAVGNHLPAVHEFRQEPLAGRVPPCSTKARLGAAPPLTATA